MEIAAALGELYRDGWRPKRSIVLAGWDGEEYGLLGSTEYAENNAATLRAGAIAYLNMDGTAGRKFGTGSVPALDAVIRAVTSEVPDPGGKGSVYDAWAAASTGTPTPGRLGSGSDYTAVLQHLGIAAADIGFGSPGGSTTRSTTISTTPSDSPTPASRASPRRRRSRDRSRCGWRTPTCSR